MSIKVPRLAWEYHLQQSKADNPYDSWTDALY